MMPSEIEKTSHATLESARFFAVESFSVHMLPPRVSPVRCHDCS
jgi:hypothetical protein